MLKHDQNLTFTPQYLRSFTTFQSTFKCQMRAILPLSQSTFVGSCSKTQFTSTLYACIHNILAPKHLIGTSICFPSHTTNNAHQPNTRTRTRTNNRKRRAGTSRAHCASRCCLLLPLSHNVKVGMSHCFLASGPLLHTQSTGAHGGYCVCMCMCVCVCVFVCVCVHV